MPVGNASDGIGLYAGQVMVSANMNMQHINWSHDPVPPNLDLEHFGHLSSLLLIPTVTVGLSDYWNFNYTQIIGLRSMEWGPHVESVHHRTETSLDDFVNAKGGLLGDSKLLFKYLLYNTGHEAGNRMFLGFGLLMPSDNVLTSDPFFLEEDENNDGVAWEEDGHEHRHFALSDGNYKGLLELQYFNKRATNPVFWGIKLGAAIPFQDSNYGYKAGKSYNAALSTLFKPDMKIITNPIGISLGLMLLHAGQGYWEEFKDPTSLSTILIPSVGAIWKSGNGTLSLNMQKPLLIDGVGAGSENTLNNTFDAIEITIGYRHTLDYVIPWLYF